jgi:hypothetical protein
MVLLSDSTRDGSVIFAKNSDRPEADCSVLVQVTTDPPACFAHTRRSRLTRAASCLHRFPAKSMHLVP